ncbi:prolyl oligopeptidase family serine peptidase [Roseateles sp. BYS180W]|uniref:Prolyl oligopeptidase family serine peptidase n=1 Tax=Roseateles rivi TaxID=3299028 RepID=A0ABW7FTW0_9BURK
MSLPTPLLLLSALGASALLAASPAMAAAPAEDAPVPIALRDFFKSPERTAFKLSSNGRWLSWLAPAAAQAGQPQRMNIFIQALDGLTPKGEPRQLTREQARDIAGYFWKGDGTLLYAKDFGGDENFHVVAVEVGSGKITDLTPFEKVRASLVDDLPGDPEHILVQHNQRDAKVFDVLRIHLPSGKSTLVAQNPGNILSWVTDHQGQVRVGVAGDGVNATVLYRAKEADALAPIITTDFRTSVSPLFFDADNRQLLALSNRGRDKLALVRIDPATPDKEELLFADGEADLDGAQYSRHQKRLLWASYTRAKTQQHFFDASTRAVFERLRAQLPERELRLVAHTEDEQRLVVAAFSDRDSGTHYLYDTKSNQLQKLGDTRPWLPQARMATMQPISYKARDGLTIHGYLTLPSDGKGSQNRACVVNPHGGPWARDNWGFNPQVQFLASRGYCVLQMNFRGSTGYGRSFWEASFNQWGLAMQDDVTDGTRWLIQQGYADPKRVGIYGASYGGYATLMGITKEPELYAAAVDYVGVSNLLTFMNSIPPYWKPMLDKLQAMVGHPERDKERLTANSPALNADKIKTPLFVAQGAKDPRVVKSESDQMVEALRRRGVTVQYMVKDNEGHGFRNEENRFEFYEAMEKFFAQHLKP